MLLATSASTSTSTTYIVLPSIYSTQYVLCSIVSIGTCTVNDTVLRQVFDMARDGGDDWVEDRFYKGKKIE